jgi:hypothetical protein
LIDMAVLVIGMHRSGTSALASMLEALGLNMGATDRLLPADDHNPQGYFEQDAVVAFNDEVFDYFGGAWDAPPVFPPGWAAKTDLDVFVGRLRTLLGELYDCSNYVLKDPRISLLLPLWRQALPEHSSVVVMVRDPMEVALSLHKRDTIPVLSGLALWCEYNRSLLRDLNGMPVHVCSYAQLIASPQIVTEDVAQSLHQWGELGENADLAAAMNRVNPDLRRSVSAANTARPLPVEATNLMEFLLAQLGPHESFDASDDEESGWWDEEILDYRRVVRRQRLDFLAENARLLSDYEAVLADSALLQAELDRWREMPVVRTMRSFRRRLRPNKGE